MTKSLTRRDFLKLGGSAIGAVALGEFIPPMVAHAARDNGQLDANGDGYIASMCEMCVWRCGLLAKVKDGRVVKLEGDPDHPHSKGKLCPRGRARLMNTYDPDRVLTPLIRVGNHGEGKFRKRPGTRHSIWWPKTCSTLNRNTAPRRWSFRPPITFRSPCSKTCCRPSVLPITVPSALCVSTP